MTGERESLFPDVRRAIANGRRDAQILDGRSFDPSVWDDAEDQIDKAQDALRNWSECYPEEVFIPVSDEQLAAVVALLKENGYTPDALYAHWGRHIVKCLRREMGQ